MIATIECWSESFMPQERRRRRSDDRHDTATVSHRALPFEFCQNQRCERDRYPRQRTQHATRSFLRLRQEACGVCQGSELQACYNCDGQGSYKTYGVMVLCKGCKGSGNVLCRSCFKGDPWDIEAARTRAEERRKDGLLGFRKQTPPDAPDGILQ